MPDNAVTEPGIPGIEPGVPVIEMVQPLPGFPDLRRFVLVRLDEDGSDEGWLCALRSLDDPDLRFLVVPPTPFFPDYAPEVDEASVADLEIEAVEDILVLVILNASGSLATTTANLAAPVLINRANQRACQVVLDDPGLSVSTPLVA